MHLVGYNVHLDKLLRACGLSTELTHKDFGQVPYKFVDSPLSPATQLGDHHAAKNEYIEAIKHYTEALAELSKKKKETETNEIVINTLYARSQCYIQLHKHQKALSDLDCILSINPLFRKAYTSRANVFLTINNQHAAALDLMRLSELETTVSLQPKQHQQTINNDKETQPLSNINYHSIVNTGIVILSFTCTVVCVGIAVLR